MKMTFPFGGAVVAALATNQNVQADNLAAAAAKASALVNRPIDASPHGLEAFSWLRWPSSPPTETKVRSESVLSTIKKNRALANSPRMREQFPELARAEQPSTVASSKTSVGKSEFDQVIQNRALVNSPRMREKFPQLTRGYTSPLAKDSLEVAPLK